MYSLLEDVLTILNGLVSKFKKEESLIFGSVLVATLFTLIVLTFLFILAAMAFLSA